jgi:unsaturated rhamnogalacturonyl hydrolase
MLSAFKKIFFIGLFALVVLTGCKTNDINREDSLITSKQLVDSFMQLHPDTIAYPSEAKSYKWNYEQGLIMEAMFRVWKSTGDDKIYNYIKKNINYFIEENGSIKTYLYDSFNIDNITPGRVLLHLYANTKLQKYKIAADTLMKQLSNHPRTSEGGFWHKKIYPNQMWLDGLYMAEPFYSEYLKMFNNPEMYDDIANQFLLIKEHLYDAKTGLYYHGWDESKQMKWSDPVKGTSPNFWGRSIGWFMMAMVDVLDSYPENQKSKNEILKMFQELSSALLKFRDDKTKLWYQVIDQSNREGNYIETSSSAMFIYSFAKGYNKGYLDESYLNIAKESYKYLINNFVEQNDKNELFLNNVCSVGGLGGNPYRDGSFEYYISEPIRVNDFKGYGPLILAANELQSVH